MAVAAANSIANDRLNDLLIDIGRSLLQYTSESWPWASACEQETHLTLDRLAAEQRDVVAALANVLTERNHVLELGAYPTDYTGWHYVGVDFLLARLIANQQDVLKGCEAVAAATPDDDDAKSLLDDVVVSERKHLDELKQLAANR